LYILLISISCCIASTSPSPSLPQQTGWGEVDEITLLTSSGSPTAGLTLCNNSTLLVFCFIILESLHFAKSSVFDSLISPSLY
jgi:hypothetical protein